ncbi:hypothetical protein BFW38_00235 [Terasakiispira papahanaumokuakeensis]|uniref:DNA-binding response regulator n=1 Tax=Terasakiispira papahanaumokuakeensis TaxID=197479 RepID=A0A1E2V5R3_9GAMM|nr:response regulator transcription factor [Terasakiispira papahanaumokuakeensis]ODC02206.1 hypothetical protein BFW38_00235 [Terasakiispira papahanaumokuakeensis]
MEMPVKVLLVEDDVALCYLCARLLKKEGLQVESVSTYKEAEKRLLAQRYQLILLDLGLPDGDGLALAQRFGHLDDSKILMMTARGAAQARLEGFEAGACDYLIKPFHPGEFLHRVQRILQQVQRQAALRQFGGWVLDMNSRSLKHEQHGGVTLTRGEFELLDTLLNANERPLSRQQLLDVIARDVDSGNPRSVDVLISRLRKKIEDVPAQPVHLLTVPSVGYRLVHSP